MAGAAVLGTLLLVPNWVSRHLFAQPAPASTAVPREPEDIVAYKAYAALDRHCARCHQHGRRGANVSGGGIANILALDEIARDPSLVRPGLPDASRLYTSILAGSMPPDEKDGDVQEPTPLEMQALRDWIKELPVAGAGCGEQRRLMPEMIGQQIAQALDGLAPETARVTRFLSLANLYNSCTGEKELAGLRQATSLLLSVLSRAGAPFKLEALGSERVVLRLSLADIGWHVTDWDRLAATSPRYGAPSARVPDRVSAATGTDMPILDADWVAHAALAAEARKELLSLAGAASSERASLSDGNARIIAGEDAATAARLDSLGIDPELRVWGLSPLDALRHAYRRSVDAVRAAADFGVAPPAFLDLLEKVDGADAFYARLLRHDVVRRRDAERLLQRLSHSPRAGDVVQAAAERPPSPALALWTDKDRYAPGDFAVFSAQSNQDCHLTLINVDNDGRAIVLFPNEFEASNKIAAGDVRRVPGPGAGYRLRMKEPGRELLIGICTRDAAPPDGIVHDFMRLRFTVLGDWQLFLRDPGSLADARRDDAATASPRPKRRQRRRARGGDQKGEPADGHEMQARTAIAINVR
ncbi:MAG: DUF4384 domain-containing protein [Hyphomicrobiaceae bacterium]